MKKIFVFLLLICFVLSIIFNIGSYIFIKKLKNQNINDTIEIVKIDTINSIPEIKYKKIIKYISIPSDTVFKIDSITKDINAAIVQKEYSDDSSYTAYISGIEIDSFPKLDSIFVYRKNIERIINHTIYKKKHWQYGIGVNSGVSVITYKPDITVGVFIGYTF